MLHTIHDWEERFKYVPDRNACRSWKIMKGVAIGEVKVNQKYKKKLKTRRNVRDFW